MKKYATSLVMSPILICFCLFILMPSAKASLIPVPFASLVDTIDVKIKGDFYICEGDTNKLSISKKYDKIKWSVVGSGNIITDNLSSDTIEIDAEGTYQVLVTDSDGNSGSAQIKVQLSKVYGGILPSTRDSICLGDSLELYAFGGAQTFDSYAWLELGEINSKVVVYPTENTTYTLEVTNANKCSDSYEYTVNVNPNPIASLLDYDPLVCEKSSFMVGVSSDQVYQYRWNTRDTTSSITKTLRKDKEVYSVTVTNEHDCSIELTTDSIQMKIKDDLSLYAEELVLDVDTPEKFVVQGISDEECFDSFVWKIDDSIVEGQTGSSAMLTFSGMENKQLVCVEPKVNSSCLCTYEELCVEVFVVNEGDCSGTISQNNEVKQVFETCVNGTILLEGNSFSGASSLLNSTGWTINNIVVTSLLSNDIFNVTEYVGKDKPSSSLELEMKKTGTYQIVWSFAYKDCSKTREATIHVLPNPEVDLVFDTLSGCTGDDFEVFVHGKNVSDYDYSLTYSSNNVQAILDLSSSSPNSIQYNSVQDTIKLKLIQLKDEDTGCLVKFTDKGIEKPFYKPMSVKVDTNCIDGEGLYYSEITALDGSGDFEFIGAGKTTSVNIFKTETLVEGNGTLIEVNDKKCPSFNQKVEPYVTCSCLDVPIKFKIGNYEGCVGGSIFVPIEVGPTFSKGQDNVLYYEIHSKKGIKDTLVTGFIDVSGCGETYEGCEVEIPYDDVLLVDQTYNLVSYISKTVPGTDSIDRSYNCLNYFTAKEIPVTLEYKNVQILELNKTKDTVCLNQNNRVFGVSNVPFKYSVDWDTESEGVDFQKISPFHISANFTKSGNKKIIMTQAFEFGKGSNCVEEQEIDIYVRDEEAPNGVVNIALIPGNILVAQNSQYDCFEWGYFNIDNGDEVKGPKSKFWILSTVNLDKFVYYVDVWECNSKCKSRTYYNRTEPFVFVTGNQNIKNTNYKIYPNPTSSDVIIEGLNNPNESNVYLISTLGQKIKLESVPIQQGKLLARIRDLNVDGLYYITVEDSEHNVLLTKGLMIK